MTQYKVTNKMPDQRIFRVGGRLLYLNGKQSMTVDDEPSQVPEDIFKVEELKETKTKEVKKDGRSTSMDG